MEQQFTQLGIGQAFITVLNEKGIPTETVVTHLAPPKSFMGPLTSPEYQQQLDQSDTYKKYQEDIDPKSAFEILSEKMEASKKQQKEVREIPRQTTATRTRQEKSSLEQVMASPITKQIGKEIVRGVFGMLFGSAPRRKR